MPTDAHENLISQLEQSTHLPWGGRALLACLLRLRSGGPTEWKSISVDNASAFDDGFWVIYRWPSGPPIGLRVTPRSGSEPEMSTEDFGNEIADFSIAEPLGMTVLAVDASGVSWWGEQPFPSSLHVTTKG